MSVLPNNRLCSKKSFVVLCYRTHESGSTSPLLGLLRGQLDYWFSKKPKGFYKFLEPCNHPLYRAGDSWTEELGISRRVFNALFELIGIRYTSKTAFKTSNDKFQGKLYASYYDRKTSKMFYVRNMEMFQQTNKTSFTISNTKKISQEKPIFREKLIDESTHNPLPTNHSSNDTNCRSHGGTIGGKNKDSFTENTSSSLVSKVQAKKSADFTESKKIAEEIKNIWIEEIGELEINQLSSTLIARINHSYTTIFDKSLDNWRNYCRKIVSSQFLMGENKRANFKAHFSWAIKHETYERIQAGDFTLGDRALTKIDKIITFSQEDEKTLSENLIKSTKNPLWIKAGLELLKRVGGYTFNHWFKDLDIASCQGNEINFKAPSLFHRDYINRNYREQLVSSLEKVLDIKVYHLSYSV